MACSLSNLVNILAERIHRFLNVNTDMTIKNVEHAELNTKIQVIS